MPWRITSEPTKTERIVGGLSYLTFGIAGLLYMLFSKTGSQSQIFRFHFYQSIMLWVIATLLQLGGAPLVQLLVGLLSLISQPFAMTVFGGIQTGVGILTFGFDLLLLYGAIMAFLGRFAEVPLVSNLVRQNMR